MTEVRSGATSSAQKLPDIQEPKKILGVDATFKGYRASLFTGSLAGCFGDPQPAKTFLKELNRKSYRQAKNDDLSDFDEESIEKHDYAGLYGASRGEFLVAEKWKCIRKIAFGSSSVVYLAISVDFEQEAAIKVCSFSKEDEALRKETSTYYNLQGGPGIPRVYWYGQGPERHFLVMELLGPNLLDLLHFCDGKFSLKTVCMLAVQMLQILEWIHQRGYVHREIRPQNFCLGNGPLSRQIFLIDFATAIKHRPKIEISGQQYVPRVVGTRIKGKAIYDSVGAHYGNEHSYRDDVESALYILMHFLIGDLPWRGIRSTKRPNSITSSQPVPYIDQVCEKKLTSTFLEVAPPEFPEVLNHVRSIAYDQLPDYQLLIHLFLARLREQALNFDYEYDWLPDNENTDIKEQQDKEKVLAKLMDKNTRPFLELQMHRFQYLPAKSSLIGSGQEFANDITVENHTSAQEVGNKITAKLSHVSGQETVDQIPATLSHTSGQESVNDIATKSHASGQETVNEITPKLSSASGQQTVNNIATTSSHISGQGKQNEASPIVTSVNGKETTDEIVTKLSNQRSQEIVNEISLDSSQAIAT